MDRPAALSTADVAGQVATLRAKPLSDLTIGEWHARFIARHALPLGNEELEMGEAANDTLGAA